MKIQGHLHDYPLSDLLEILANRQESGCLRIEFEPEPALFYFNQGQLVDARMSFLRGFPAVHLAFSRAEAPFDFDNTVAPPESAIIDENERMLLSGILRVRLSGEGEKVELGEQRAPSISPQDDSSIEIEMVDVAVPVEKVPVKAETVGEFPAAVEGEELNASVFAKEVEPAKEVGPPELVGPTNNVGPGSVVPRNSFLIEPRFDYDKWTKPNKLDAFLDKVSSFAPRGRALRIAAVVFVIAIPATVGITVLIGKKNSSEQVIAATKESATPNQDSNATTPNTTPAAQDASASAQPQNTTPAPNADTREAETLKTPTNVAGSKPAETPATQTPTNTSTNAAPNPKPVNKPSVTEAPKNNETPKDNRSSQAQAAESPKPVEQPSSPAESTTKTIVVMVRVEDGHVAEAWVKDSRKGLEAYEATALRMARGRRYPAGANRTESVPVSVSINK